MKVSKQILLMPVVSGCLLILSFPKYGSGLVVWIALVPLLFSLREGTVKSGLLNGMVAGVVFNVGLLYWIAPVIVRYGYPSLIVGLSSLLLVAAYLALYVALFAAGVVYLRERHIARIIAAPLLWTCLEYAKSHLMTGFPWENLAYSQYLYLPLIQISDLTGIYGLTFIIVFINALMSDLLEGFVLPSKSGERKYLIMEAVCGCLMWGLLYGYGIIRLEQMQRFIGNATPFPVSLIQGNIDQSVKWNPQYQDKTLKKYNSLSEQAVTGSSGLIVWPETAVPLYFQDLGPRTKEIVSLVEKTGSWLLFGSPAYVQKNGKRFFLNSAYLMSPRGRIAGRYDKVHLVPYGEYVPFRKFFPFIGKLTAGAGDLQPGKGYHPLFLNDRKIGVLICYEIIFPEASRSLKKMGAGLLVNITNDAWFGRSSAPYQHLSMTVFRAVENRLYVLRAANTGITAVIDPGGKITSQAPMFTDAVLTEVVRFVDNGTYYMAYGDIFVYICLISLAIILLNLIWKEKICWKI